jgi:UDP-GlcNAc:undecaprenyl-phosphate/decaprenyl-phosphate GlcNAc-1-phosphate transferase
MILAGLVIAFAVALVCALLFTPHVASLAIAMGAVDRPDGRRKNQSTPIPRGGGIAVAVAAIIAVLVAMIVVSPAETSSSIVLWRGLLPALAVLLVVGAVDDVLTLTGIYKLIGQVLAVSVLVAGGSTFEHISLFGFMIPLGDLRIPFTIFFCLGAINAFNLIDGADALASTIGAIVCVTLGIITASRNDPAASLICMAIAGGLVGFLRYNIPPARVYLGDTGSMLIGLVIAAVAIDCSIKQHTAFVLAVPLAICAIPILDAGAALIRRITTGTSVFAADRGHLHHALLLRGWTVGQTVAIIAGLTAITCGSALLSYFTNSDIFALAVTGAIVIFLAAARIFGHAEAALVASRSRSLVRSIVSHGVRSARPETESAVHVQGTRKWQKLWVALREAAPNYNVSGLTLNIAIPMLHESFYATWKSKEAMPSENVWRVTLPLTLENRSIGQLSLVGAADGRQAMIEIQQLLDYLDTLHGQIDHIVGKEPVAESMPAREAVAALN